MSDTYLGGIYACSHCGVRLSQCRCEERADGWAANRYAVWIERFFYEHPIPQPPSAFIDYPTDPDHPQE